MTTPGVFRGVVKCGRCGRFKFCETRRLPSYEFSCPFCDYSIRLRDNKRGGFRLQVKALPRAPRSTIWRTVQRLNARPGAELSEIGFE